jgi:hypothetical protein
MLTVKCQGCGSVYKLSEDLYSKKAAGFGVVVTCRRCKTEIHVEAPVEAGAEKIEASEPTASEEPAMSAEPPATAEAAPKAGAAAEPKVNEPPEPEPIATSAVTNAVSPSPPRATPKATARWPEAINAPLAESKEPPPVVGETDLATAPKADAPKPADSPSSPHATAAPLPRPAPRPAAPTGLKPLVKRDPVSGPFVALSPGLLGVGRPAPPPPSSPDSEAPIDSSDFLDERKAKAAPKAPPIRPPAKSEQKEPPKRSAEPALPLKFKEPPKPPKQKPRAPVRSDDVSDDLLSADVGFEGTPAGGIGAPPTIQLETEAPRILAPDSSALAAPPADTDEREGAKGTLPSPSTSDAKPRPSSAGKSSRVVPIVLVTLGAAAAFGLAFRSQLPSSDAPAEANRISQNPAPAQSPPLPPPLSESPLPPPPASEITSAPAATSAAPTTPAALPKAGGTVARATSETPSKSTGDASQASGAAKPGTTAPAPGAPVAPEAPKTEPEGPFNAEAARTALASSVAQASACRKPGDPSGVAVVTITFSPSGRVTSATIGGPPFAGTPTGGCIAATLRRARVPPFTGDMVTVKKTVEIQ